MHESSFGRDQQIVRNANGLLRNNVLLYVCSRENTSNFCLRIEAKSVVCVLALIYFSVV